MEWLGKLTTRGVAPSARKGHSMTRMLDSPIVVVYGGEGPGAHFLDDMHTLNLETHTWARVEYADGPCPPARLLHTMTAVTRDKLVLFGGDITPPPGDAHAMRPGPANDAWLFDLRTRAWTRLAHSKAVPPPRAAHTATLCAFAGHAPAVYVFGGFQHDSQRAAAIMYRLRLRDWAWEALPVLVSRPDGADMVTTDPVTALVTLHGDPRVQHLHPGPRESHAAVFVQALDALVVLTGEEHALKDDCWLFGPAPSSTPQQPRWSWRHRPLALARGTAVDAVAPTSGVAAVALPGADKRARVLLWGGINNEEHVNDVCTAKVVDLSDGTSRCVRVHGKRPACGGLLFGVVRHGDRLIVHDGCDGNGEITPCIESAVLQPDLAVNDGGPAGHFGAEARRFARRGKPLDAPGEKSVSRVPLVGPSRSVKSGARGDVRVIRQHDFGLYVSFVVNGVVHKGLAVRDPLANADKDGADLGKLIGSAVVEDPDDGDGATAAKTGRDGTQGRVAAKPTGAATARRTGGATRTTPAPASAPAAAPAVSSAATPSSAAPAKVVDKEEEEKQRKAKIARTVQQAFVDDLPDELEPVRLQKQARPVKPIQQGEVISLDDD